ncbi:MAG: hypothetical protein WC490_07725 [Candidatus Margulisiibacteriota bacterium]
MNAKLDYKHKELASGRWAAFSFCEQMANIGSDVARAINWKRKGNPGLSFEALERALELCDLTIDDQKNRDRLKEILRMREVLADYFLGGNEYGSTDKNWQSYFDFFAFSARAGN